MEYAVIGGGCFWCLEAVFEQLDGVESVVSGYCGGRAADANYDAVCAGATDHAEVVRIGFDPQRLRFGQLLKVFFHIHDPTTPGRQGNDVGRQYRSVIFAQTPEQLQVAREAMAEAAGGWERPLVTELGEAMPFYPAEGYHQSYFRRNGEQPYCSHVVAPKLAKFRQHFGALLRQR